MFLAVTTQCASNLARLADRHELGLEAQRQRGPEEEAASVQGDNNVNALVFRGDVLEELVQDDFNGHGVVEDRED